MHLTLLTSLLFERNYKVISSFNILDYSRFLDVHSIVADDVSSCMFDLCDSGIDFLPAEVMKGDKTTGWLGADYNKVNKVWPYVWRNFDSLV